MVKIIENTYCYAVIIFLTCAISCAENVEDMYEWKSIKVRATAYNSVRWQTDGLPNLAAWGDTLKPGIKSIAVSRDLIRLGLKHNTQVKIEGLEGIYLVKDKMNRRYHNKIDIFMGKDIDSAKAWGSRKLTIEYRVKKVDTIVKSK